MAERSEAKSPNHFCKIQVDNQFVIFPTRVRSELKQFNFKNRRK